MPHAATETARRDVEPVGIAIPLFWNDHPCHPQTVKPTTKHVNDLCLLSCLLFWSSCVHVSLVARVLSSVRVVPRPLSLLVIVPARLCLFLCLSVLGFDFVFPSVLGDRLTWLSFSRLVRSISILPRVPEVDCSSAWSVVRRTWVTWTWSDDTK